MYFIRSYIILYGKVPLSIRFIKCTLKLVFQNYGSNLITASNKYGTFERAKRESQFLKWKSNRVSIIEREIVFETIDSKYSLGPTTASFQFADCQKWLSQRERDISQSSKQRSWWKSISHSVLLRSTSISINRTLYDWMRSKLKDTIFCLLRTRAPCNGPLYCK